MDINKVDAAWLSAALCTYEVCSRNNDWNLDDIYFQQSDINRIAEKFIGSEIPSAMVSTHVCAYSSNCAYNYLTSRDKARRISYSGEFNNVKERPALNSDFKIKTADDEITYDELCDFVDNEYSPRLVKLLKEKYDEFDFELIIKFIEEFGGRKYSSADKVEDASEEQEMKRIKEKGTAAREMFSAIGDEVKAYMTKYKKLDISLWKSTWHYVNNYLWAQFRKGGKEDFLSSISMSIEKNNDIYEMRVGVETRDKKCTQHEYDLHNRLLNKKRTDESLKYYVDGNLQTQLIPLDLSSDEMKKKIEDGTYKKALLSTVMYREDMKAKSSFEIFKFIIESFNKLEPYYDLAVEGDRSDYSGKQNNDGLNKNDKINGDEGDGESVMKNDLIMNKNIILSGPPGTGKTYNSVNYAVAIIENKDLQAVMDEDYAEVFERYKEYKEKGQIYFTTFHQSYGYEEFIEGLKPVLADEDTDDEEQSLEYKIEDGIFKELCKKASTISGEINSVKIPEDACVWKISLYGARENKIKTECFDDSVIRIGWDNDDYKNDDNFVKSLDSGVDRGRIKIFKEDMRIGDIVVSLYDQRTIDGIGIVTSDYYYDNENRYSEYKRIRKVKWLAKNIREDIYDLNGSIYLTQKTIYELTRIKVSAMINLLDKIKRESKGSHIESIENVKLNDKRYVMIIDEINRGNISKIFGELITLIEPSKRTGAEEEADAILPYSKTPFTVPDNVYIIGSMNTADRSIALMDTALRRRFKFVEMMPDSSLFEDVRITENDSEVSESLDYDQDGNEDRYIDVRKMIDAINLRIEYLYDREHTIGHAYFMPLKKNPSLDLLCDIFEKSIIPLLQEYFYEDYEKIQLILGDNDKDDEYKFILDEKLDIRNVFKGRDMSSIEADIPQKKYKINHDAFKKIESYMEIY